MLSSLKRLLGRTPKAPADPNRVIYHHTRISSENELYARIYKNTPHTYLWGVIQAGHLGKKLEIPRISVLEFGVAGGNGLVALEGISREVAAHYGVVLHPANLDSQGLIF